MLNNTRYKDNIWECAVAQNKTKHTAVFPEQLVQDHIESWSNKKDIVYDPFMGIGTTARACKKSKRYYIGSEIDEEHYKISKKLIND